MTSSNLVVPILVDVGSCPIRLENEAVLVVRCDESKHKELRDLERLRLMQIANMGA